MAASACADDPRLGAQLLHRQGDPGQQSAAAETDDDGLHLGALLDDLQAAGALSRNDIRVIKGWMKTAPVCAAYACALTIASSSVAPNCSTVAVSAGRVELGHGCADGHIDLGRDPELLARQRDALGVVARARRHNPTGLLLLRQSRDARERPRILKDPARLRVLALEQDGRAQPLRQHARMQHRRRPHEAAQLVAGGEDIGIRHGRGVHAVKLDARRRGPGSAGEGFRAGDRDLDRLAVGRQIARRVADLLAIDRGAQGRILREHLNGPVGDLARAEQEGLSSPNNSTVTTIPGSTTPSSGGGCRRRQPSGAVA